MRYPEMPISSSEKQGVETKEIALENDLDKAKKKDFNRGYWRKNSLFGSDVEVKSDTSFYFRLTGTVLYYTESPVLPFP